MNSTKSEHTPGPWETMGAIVWSPSSKRVVAAACEPEPKSHCVEYERADIGSKNLNEVYANARLIAACPSMFAYIQKMAESGDEWAIQIVEDINAKG